MANFRLEFLSIDKCSDKNLTVFHQYEEETGFDSNSIRIAIGDRNDLNEFAYFDMDVSTAIKFAKTLRTEINKIKEVKNA